MHNKRLNKILICCLVATLVVACSKKTNDEELLAERRVSQENLINENVTTTVDSIAEEILHSKTAVYVGMLYGEYGFDEITMDLVFNGNNVTGYYYLGSNDKRNLTGTITGNKLELVEEDGSQEFIGTLDALEFHGFWFSENGSNSFGLTNISLLQEKTTALFTETGALDFELSSGSGSWSTTLHIAEDGTFNGVYSDFDRGFTGDDYPNGTRHYLEFDSNFVFKEKIDDYTYSLTREYIDFPPNVKLGTDKIVDGYKYIYTEPYGLSEDNEFILCLPGKPRSELSEEVLGWDLQYKFGENQTDTLPYYALYGVKSEMAFYSK